MARCACASNMLTLTSLQYLLGAVSGSLVGFTLGLVGGGGSILAVPLMIYVVGVLMLRRRHDSGVAGAACHRGNAGKVLSFGFGTGVFSGFFGIGGGFLIVPGLIGSTNMPILNAVGTSLVAVTAFGLTTSLNYALSGLVDWPLAGVFIAGGVMGSTIGTTAAKRLAGTAGRLTSVFAMLIFLVAAYMLWRGSHP